MALTSLRLGLRGLGGMARQSVGPLFNGNPYSFYSLLDIFEDAQVAGAVNGTLPVVGGARVVTDTNGKLSIAGGVANFATGGAGAGDPGLWYASQARVFGRVIIGTITQDSGTGGTVFGWDSNQSGAAIDYFSLTGGGALQIVGNNAISPIVGAYSPGTTYQLAIVMRSTGMYWFIKGGAFTNYTLAFQSALGSAAMFPVCEQVSATAVVFTADNIRIPSALYIVPCLAYDTFTRANGALGNSETSGPDAQAVTARAWTNYQGAWQVLGNLASCSSVGASGSAVAAYDTGASDVLHDVTCVSACNVGGVTRLSASDNFVSGWYDGTNAYLDKWVSGASTRVISAAAASAANAVIRQIVSGTSFSLYYNNAKVGATSTISDAGLQNNTKQGLYTNTTSGSADAVTTWPRGTRDEYAGLDSF